MSPTAQRIAIAEACGWIPNPNNARPNRTHLFWHRGTTERVSLPACDDGYWPAVPELPNYVGDLNAMHEAWKTLSAEQYYSWRLRLREIIHRDGHIVGPCKSITNATASQRAEAFLRTLNLWQE